MLNTCVSLKINIASNLNKCFLCKFDSWPCCAGRQSASCHPSAMAAKLGSVTSSEELQHLGIITANLKVIPYLKSFNRFYLNQLLLLFIFLAFIFVLFFGDKAKWLQIRFKGKELNSQSIHGCWAFLGDGMGN